MANEVIVNMPGIGKFKALSFSVGSKESAKSARFSKELDGITTALYKGVSNGQTFAEVVFTFRADIGDGSGFRDYAKFTFKQVKLTKITQIVGKFSDNAGAKHNAYDSHDMDEI